MVLVSGSNEITLTSAFTTKMRETMVHHPNAQKLLPILDYVTRDSPEAGEYVHLGTDAEDRPIFVGFQSIHDAVKASVLKENSLGDGVLDIQQSVDATHTELSPTPQRMDGTTTEGLAQEVLDDPARFATVTDRIHSTRDLLANGSQVVAIYSRQAMLKAQDRYLRGVTDGPVVSEKDVATYASLSDNHPNHVDRPVDTDPSNPEDAFSNIPSGATNALINGKEQKLVFMIEAPQAGRPKAGQWKFWFGNPDKHIPVAKEYERRKLLLAQNDVKGNIIFDFDQHLQASASYIRSHLESRVAAVYA